MELKAILDGVGAELAAGKAKKAVEISSITNLQDAGLLATEKYRQQIAEALLVGITRYQQALKKAPAVATQ